MNLLKVLGLILDIYNIREKRDALTKVIAKEQKEQKDLQIRLAQLNEEMDKIKSSIQKV